MRYAGRQQRGFTLIEALVAFLVMAVGLIAFTQVQIMLRLNADVSKQRSEAVRIAQEQIEELRSFTSLTTSTDPAVKSFDGTIAALASTSLTGLTTNTTFKVARSVDQDPVTQMKVLRVTVTWKDRSATGTADNQTVSLASVIGRTDPALTARLQTPPLASTSMRSPLNRNVRIPLQALDLGGGLSGFTPPGAPFYYVFNNNDASVFQQCSGTLSAEAYATNKNNTNVCTNTPGYFISGSVSFDLGVVGNLVEQGGKRPADPSNTVCDFYRDAQTKGLITSSTNLSGLQISEATIGPDPSLALLSGPIYALAVTLTASQPSPATGTTGFAVANDILVSINAATGVAGYKVDTGVFASGVTITLTNSSTGTVVGTWTGAGSATISNSFGTLAIESVTSAGAATLRVNPSADLTPNTQYSLQIPVGALRFSSSKNNSPNIVETNSSALTISFTTTFAVPSLTSVSPLTNSTNVAQDVALRLTFSQNMALGSSGTITLSRVQGGTAKDVESWPKSGSASGVSISDNVVTLTPVALLLPGETYFITVASGALRSVASEGSVAYPGFSGDQVFRFTTAAAPAAGCPTSSTVRAFFDLTMANFSTSHSGTLASNFACYSDATSKATQTPFVATSNTQVDPDPGWRYVSYFCVVTGNPSLTSKLSWNGRLLLEGPPGWISTNTYKVCRYTNPLNKSALLLTADDHPQDYASVQNSITDQNFLVIEGNKSCPSQVLTVQGQSIYYTTVEMQPSPGAN